MKFTPRSRKSKGFSLVELLVVIVVVGIMAALAIPVLANVSQQAQINKDQRNAQSIAAVAGAAQAAGAALNTTSLSSAITNLQQGVNGTGIFSSSIFKAAPFDADQLQGLSQYLTLSGNTLVYTNTPVTP
jgi:type IV pilus assembly protein PilA